MPLSQKVDLLDTLITRRLDIEGAIAMPQIAAQPGAQSEFIDAHDVFEVFYGGERGGGKSIAQLLYQASGVMRYGSGHKGLIARKTYPELEELQKSAMTVFTPIGGIYKSAASVNFPESRCWYFPNGATVIMRYLATEADYGTLHGKSITALSLDEVTEYESSSALLKLMSILRSPVGVPCTIRMTGNPGGVGHAWVSERFIDPSPPRTIFTDEESGAQRLFIPSKLSDNLILDAQDPHYRSRIIAATYGNEALRKAWLEGDWNIVAGAFFTEWNTASHVCTPFEIPDEWLKFRAMDWGSAAPFAVLWFAVVSDLGKYGGSVGGSGSGSGTKMQRGDLVVYREWYGADSRGEGLKMPVDDIGRGIMAREQWEAISYGVLDPAAFSEDGGPSIAERLFRAGAKFNRADNSRVAGWQQVRGRLSGVGATRGDASAGGSLRIFNTCPQLIRHIPMAQHDSHRLEDIDTKSKTDHDLDCFLGHTMVNLDTGPMRIDAIPATGMVYTQGGTLSPYILGGYIKHSDKCVRVTLSNGVVIECTSDHKIMDDQGDLQGIDELLVSKSGVLWTQSNSKVWVESVEPLPGSHPTYCLTVPDTGVFAIEGGLIVSNCLRYGLMSRPIPFARPPDKHVDGTFDQFIKGETSKRNDRI